MVSLGIILLIIGAVVAIACHFATVPVGVRIGLGVAVLGGILILLGYLLPSLGHVGDGVDEPNHVGMSALL